MLTFLINSTWMCVHLVAIRPMVEIRYSKPQLWLGSVRRVLDWHCNMVAARLTLLKMQPKLCYEMCNYKRALSLIHDHILLVGLLSIVQCTHRVYARYNLNVRFNPWKRKRKKTIVHECVYKRSWGQKTLSYTLTQTMYSFMFPSSSDIYTLNVEKTLIFGLGYRKGVQQPWRINCKRHIHCFTYGLFHWWSNRQPSSSGELQSTVEDSVLEFFTLFFAHIWQASQVYVSLPSFKPPHAVWYWVMVLISNPWGKKHKNKTRAGSGRLARRPVHVRGYTPSSMPMKSEPFCIVMEAPAALSTNMEVYCPVCGGKIHDTEAERFARIQVFFVSLDVSLTCSSSSPCTLTVNILLLLSSPTIISSELQCYEKRRRPFLMNIVFSTIGVKCCFFQKLSRSEPSVK